MGGDIDDLIASCLELAKKIDGSMDELAGGLATKCSANGAIDPRLFDSYQGSCYELALACSESIAIRILLQAASGQENHVVARLAVVFTTETLPVLLNRLQKISSSIGCADKVAALFVEPVYLRLLETANLSWAGEVGRDVFDTGDQYKFVETNQDVDMAREIFAKLAREVIAPLAEEIHRQDLIVPDIILDRLRSMGVFGLTIPERWGGVAPDDGEDSLSMMAITEALSEASLGAAGSLITRPEILSRAILVGGTDDQKQYWLPRIALGDPLCAIAITEPDYGSDVGSIALTATRTASGWVLNGAKTWCTFAGKAGVIMVVARTGPGSGYRGLSIFLVKKESVDGHSFREHQVDGGELTGSAISTIGYRGMHSFDLSFQNFFVSDECLLGGEEGLGCGFYYTMAGMTGGRIQTAARACGVMSGAIAAARSYASDRVVFGSPLSTYQLTQVKIAKMCAEHLASRHIAYWAAGLVNGGNGKMEASLAKLFACRRAETVTREALQLHGGMGYAEESAVSRYFVDARVLSIFEGAEETLALKVVARELLQKALR